MRTDMVESYVRDLVERITGSRPEPDDDGDLPIEYGNARFYVRVINGGDPVVQVFSIAVAELESTPGLVSGLNEINSMIHFARIFHVQGQVLIESEIWGSDVNPANLRHACSNIASATDVYGPQLVEQFGGVPAFEIAKQPEYEQEDLFRSTGLGPYL
ncbi:MAG: T3SS (YopN, CesT) and YbjN peptide-binding chaperone 1 [Candidatus Nanopelagicales bacterium]